MTRKIVAIDDSDVALDIIRATLSEVGFDDVQSFESPKKALDAFMQSSMTADLILMDIMMPEIDGIELCARIRSLEPWSDTPIIMLTSRTDMLSLNDAFLAGANDYVTKPFEQIELQARIRSCLRLKSELDRRKAMAVTRPRRQSSVGTKPAQSNTKAIGGIIASQTTFRNALLELGASDLEKLGLIVLRIDCLTNDAADFSTTERASIIADVGSRLAGASGSSGDLFAHWEDELFCVASILNDENALMALAESYLDIVRSQPVAALGGTGGKVLTISAGVALPGTISGVAAGLADTLIASREASSNGGNKVRVVKG